MNKTVRYAIISVALFLIYFLAGKVGLLLGFYSERHYGKTIGHQTNDDNFN